MTNASTTDEIATPSPTARKRRRHSPEFKARVVRACGKAGASVTAVAHAHGVGTNLVHRWLADARSVTPPGAAVPAPGGETRRVPADGFVAARIEPVAAVPDIRIELRRGPASVVVHWPLQGAQACAEWLQQWLR